MTSAMNPQPLQYASPDAHRPKPWGQGFVAVCATFVVWGLGHLISHKRNRALTWFALWILSKAAVLLTLGYPRLAPAFLVVAPVEIILLIVVCVDAFLCGRRDSRSIVPSAILRYLIGVLLLVGALVWSRVTTYAVTRLGESFIMPTRSMMPTLAPGDRFLASKLAFKPKRWDVVIFYVPGGDRLRYVKRVAGLPGETVEIVNGSVRINGVAVQSPPSALPYTQLQDRLGNGCEGNPIKLGRDEYFMLGDNSPISGDSRYWEQGAPGHQAGALPRSEIIGRVTLRFWPLDRIGVVH